MNNDTVPLEERSSFTDRIDDRGALWLCAYKANTTRGERPRRLEMENSSSHALWRLVKKLMKYKMEKYWYPMKFFSVN